MDEPTRLAACRSETLSQMAQPKTTAEFMTTRVAVQSLCYAEVNDEDILVDYSIRKSAYLNQQPQTTILLWMVVTITFSGVFLAGVQLFAAYKLAAAGKADFDAGGELSAEKNKLSVKSSVAGVVILAISLLFFYVFVRYVYLIQPVGDAPVTSRVGVQAPVTPLSSGGPAAVAPGGNQGFASPPPGSVAPLRGYIGAPSKAETTSTTANPSPSRNP